MADAPEQGGGEGAGGAQGGEAADEDELAQAIRLSLRAEEGGAPARPTTAQAGHRSVAEPAGTSAEAAGSAAGAGPSLETEFHFVTECFFLALVSGRRARLRARVTLRLVGSRLGAGPKP